MVYAAGQPTGYCSKIKITHRFESPVRQDWFGPAYAEGGVVGSDQSAETREKVVVGIPPRPHDERTLRLAPDLRARTYGKMADHKIIHLQTHLCLVEQLPVIGFEQIESTADHNVVGTLGIDEVCR